MDYLCHQHTSFRPYTANLLQEYAVELNTPGGRTWERPMSLTNRGVEADCMAELLVDGDFRD